LTLKGPCIVIYSYNKSQGDALFLRMTSLADSHITSMTNTNCSEYNIKTPDDGQ